MAACVNWIATTFPEAPLRVLDGKGEPIPDHPLLDLIDNPNDYYDGNLLLQATLTDFSVTGNAYWLIVPSADRRPLQLWYAPSWMITPRWPLDGSEFVSHYEYNPNGTPQDIPPESVVHFRYGLDPLTRLGVSRLAPVLGEVFTDQEAAAFTGALLKNMGVPGVILAPKAPDAAVDPEVAEEMKARFARAFGGDKRGSVMVIEEPTDVSVLSFTPQQMDLKGLRRIPEERVSAVMGVPAIVAGLGAGLDRSTYANMAEAREMAYESNIIPTQRLIAAAIRRQLLRHYTGDRRLRIDFDLSQVRVLQEDENAKSQRLLAQWQGGAIKRAEVRKALNWEVHDAEDEVYLIPSKSTLLPAGLSPEEAAGATKPQPAQAAPALPTVTDVTPQPAQLTAGKGRKAAPEGDTALSSDEVERLYELRLAAVGKASGNGKAGH